MRRNWRWCLQRRWLFAFLATVCSADRTVIACVGDSITYGGGDSKGYSYPFRLQESLGSSSFSVLNFGESGATVSPTVDQYQEKFSDTYEDALESGADVFVIQLGTNDAKTKWWNATTYRASMNAFLDTFVALPQVPKLVLSVPPPYVYYDDSWDDVNANAINAELPTIVPEIAKVRGIPYANNYKAFGGLENFNEDYYWLPYDGIHPNPSGYERIAWEIYQTLRENYFPDITYFAILYAPADSHPCAAPDACAVLPSDLRANFESINGQAKPPADAQTLVRTFVCAHYGEANPAADGTSYAVADPEADTDTHATTVRKSNHGAESGAYVSRAVDPAVLVAYAANLAETVNRFSIFRTHTGTFAQSNHVLALDTGSVVDDRPNEFGAAEARAFEVAVEETMDLPQGTVTVVTPATSNSERRRLLQETTVVFEIVSSIPVIRREPHRVG
ncbi:hypothetical protein CTAYLR_006659 [Chrysophaeum taylorii]|uniref:SGNH hydrolase-type esterase domain-containing protein n=1 Tax=Chrysophaeum taylorii TaxID=2483200 RepID=A0AAD7UDC6_9STRA|nr:hypothetical protein CTAYLR_006659 [Chrysophaeum taylorii]